MERFSSMERFFRLSERGSTHKTELFAGFVCFMANAYQLVLIPEIMSNKGLGLNKDVYLFAFCVSTAVSSILVGLLSNLPLPAGVGIGCSTYVAYSLTLHETPPSLKPAAEHVLARQEFGSTICFVASALMSVVACLGIAWWLFRHIPPCVKNAMPVGLGFLLSLEGFQQMALVVTDKDSGMLVMGTPIYQFSIIAGALAAVWMAFLHSKHYKTAVLLPLFTFTLIGWAFGEDGLKVPGCNASLPDFHQWPKMWHKFGTTFIDFKTFEIGRAILPIISLYLICLFDVGGITYAVASVAGLVERQGEKDEHLPGAHGVFIACGLGSMVAAALGCSPVIALGESFAGVIVGGRTGLTAIWNAFFFLLAIPLAPIFSAIPTFASAPVLVLLGVDLLALTKFLELDDPIKALPSFCTIALMPYLYSIDRAIIAGLLVHFLLQALLYANTQFDRLQLKCASCLGYSTSTTPATLPLAAQEAGAEEAAQEQPAPTDEVAPLPPPTTGFLSRTQSMRDTPGGGDGLILRPRPMNRTHSYEPYLLAASTASSGLVGQWQGGGGEGGAGSVQ